MSAHCFPMLVLRALLHHGVLSKPHVQLYVVGESTAPLFPGGLPDSPGLVNPGATAIRCMAQMFCAQQQAVDSMVGSEGASGCVPAW
jgi:hypothetical protein